MRASRPGKRSSRAPALHARDRARARRAAPFGFLKKFYGWYLGPRPLPRPFKQELVMLPSLAEVEAAAVRSRPGRAVRPRAPPRRSRPTRRTRSCSTRSPSRSTAAANNGTKPFPHDFDDSSRRTRADPRLRRRNPAGWRCERCCMAGQIVHFEIPADDTGSHASSGARCSAGSSRTSRARPSTG